MDFSLRPWHMDDLANLVGLANNYEIAKNLSDQFPHPYTSENGEAFIRFATSHDPLHIFAIDIDGLAAGGIGIHPQSDIYRKNAEMGYWLGQPFWGRGIISRAVLQMVDYGFRNFDIDRIYARPFGTNTASQKVLEKTGFILEARIDGAIFKNGVYFDELIYASRRKK